MISIEDKIKECTSYEIKTTSDDILRKFEMKKRISTHRFKFNFKIAFASLGVAFAVFAAVFSGIRLSSKDTNLPNDYNDGIVINEFVELSDDQRLECSKVACEMAPAASLIKNLGFNNTSLLSLEDDAKEKFRIIENSLKDIYYNDYSSIRLKNINYKLNNITYTNELIIDDKSSIYFEKNIFDELATEYESKGLLKIENNYYRISKKDSKITIFLKQNDENDKVTVSYKDDIYSYVISNDRVQILNVNFKEIDDYISVYLNYRQNKNEDDVKYRYKVYQLKNSLYVEYVNRDSKKDNGVFEI